MAMVYYLTENGYTLCSKHLDAWRPIGARLATPADEVGECADCLEEVCRCGHDRHHHAARAAIPGDPGAPCLECESDTCRDFVECSADRYHLGTTRDCPTCSARPASTVLIVRYPDLETDWEVEGAPVDVISLDIGRCLEGNGPLPFEIEEALDMADGWEAQIAHLAPSSSIRRRVEAQISELRDDVAELAREEDPEYLN